MGYIFGFAVMAGIFAGVIYIFKNARTSSEGDRWGGPRPPMP